ncbi:FACT complex subunit spt16 [Coemansia javaensis]|uniref:FACT complex subunit n=1 Tax=Coemansia javaensis TaxID=2761396 RepID=A0A9W8LJC5_9FUNG|nr:FACT complex subunit spt16 [Coemansia javaensis]
MSDKKLDSAAFHRRARRLLDAWKLWLFGYEFSDTILLFTKDRLLVTTQRKKAKILQPLQDAADGVPLEISVIGKEPGPDNAAAYDKAVSALRAAGPTVGHIAGETPASSIVDEWNGAFAGVKGEFSQCDVAALIADALAIKEKGEIKHERAAAAAAAVLMQDYFVDEMARVFDEEEAISNHGLAERVEGALTARAVEKRLQGRVADLGMVEWSGLPSVQSGGKYDLSPQARSSGDALHAGTVVCTLNMRYFMYNASVSRTFMIDPTPEQEKNYLFLLELHKQALAWLRPGAAMGAVYDQAAAYVRERRPDLAEHLAADCGFVTGFEMQDGANVLAPGCERTLAAGMVVVLRVALENLPNAKAAAAADARAATYAYQLADTALVRDGADAEVLAACIREPNDVSFFFNDDDQGAPRGDAGKASTSTTAAAATAKAATTTKAAAPAAPASAAGPRGTTTRTSAILSSKFRSDEREEESTTRQRREHQKELLARLHAEGRRRFAGDEGQASEETHVARKFESYKRETAIPRDARHGKILVDERADTIVLPIYGMAVPFHISTLKSISKSDEGEYVYLRLNMVSPGQGVGKKDNSAVADGPASTFVRSLSFRSTDVARMTEIYHSISALKRDQTKRETERAQLADIVEQDRLVPAVGQRPRRLADVFMRPLADSKRFPAGLEIHTNGLRYMAAGRASSSGGGGGGGGGSGTVDILFNNIRHMFFQPCDRELLVLIHFHLKNPVMLGKKRTQDIQFYREASDASFDETGNRRRRVRYGDEDEIEAEQEELRRRRQLNKEFEEFANRIVEASNHEVELDKPFRNIAFTGVPSRANVLLQPTVECLVHLSDTPFFVLTVADVEIVHLERVQFGLKNFDMVFVFRDFKRAPVHINTVPMKQLDDIKEWLDSVNLVFTEGPVNLNWAQIMKTVNKDPADFYDEGGWSFLAHDSDAEDSASEEEESEFAVSEDEFEASESESDSGSDFGSESDESDEVGDDDDDDDDEGEDWDALEAEAKAHDDKRHRADASPSRRAPAKRQRRK